MPKLVIFDRLFVPRKLINPKKLLDHYQTHSFDETTCRGCPVRPRRFLQHHCGNCAGYLGIIKSWSLEEIKGRPYVAVPAGNLKQVKVNLDLDFKWGDILDKRPDRPFTSPIKFTGELWEGGKDKRGRPRANQKKLVSDWLRRAEKNKTGGMIQCPPRSGKSILGIAIACTLRQRTYITASQIDFLKQFCMRFGELTNLKSIVSKVGIDKSPVIIIVPEDWPDGKLHGVKVLRKWGPECDKADVILSSYQQFIHPKTGGPRLKKYLQAKFGLAIIDEADLAAANSYSRVLNRMACRYKLGLTATVERKDGGEKLVASIIGSKLAEGQDTALRPTITLWETGRKIRDYKQWHYLEAAMVKDDVRNKMIVRQCFADLRSHPKASILIAVRRVEHAIKLTRMINQQAQVRRSKGETIFPEHTAMIYKGGVNRDNVISRVNKFQSRVVVAIAKMVQRGLDVQAWTHVYVGVVPTSNVANFWQWTSRVCTPADYDKPCIARVLIDEGQASVYCFRSLVYGKPFGIAVGLKSTPQRYLVSDKTLARIKEIISHPRVYSFKDAPDFTRLGIPKSERGDKAKEKAGYRSF